MEVKYTVAMGILKLSLFLFFLLVDGGGGGGGMRVGWKVNFFIFFFLLPTFLKVIDLIYGQGRLV